MFHTPAHKQVAAPKVLVMDDAAWGIERRGDGSIVEADTGALIVPAEGCPMDDVNYVGHPTHY